MCVSVSWTHCSATLLGLSQRRCQRLSVVVDALKFVLTLASRRGRAVPVSVAVDALPCVLTVASRRGHAVPVSVAVDALPCVPAWLITEEAVGVTLWLWTHCRASLPWLLAGGVLSVSLGLGRTAVRPYS